MLIGAVIGWGWASAFSSLAGDITTAAATLAQSTWSHKCVSLAAVRLAFRAIWDAAKISETGGDACPARMAASTRTQSGQSRHAPIARARTFRFGIVRSGTLACMRLSDGYGVFGNSSGPVRIFRRPLSVRRLCRGLMSFFVSAAAGYMAGLIGPR